MKQSIDGLRESASKCRDLASSAITSGAREVLSELADKYDQKAIAAELEQAAHPRRVSAFKWHLN